MRTNSSAESFSRAPCAGGVPGEGDEFLGAARGGQFFLGLQTETAHQAVRGVVQMPDQRPERGGEAALWSGYDLGHCERAGDRPVLRHQFTHHHQHHCGDRDAQQGGDGGHRCAGQPRCLQGPAQQGGERRFGEHADDQRGDGDAQLGAGELEGQALDGLQRALGAPLAGLGGAIQFTALNGGQGELGGDEHRTREGERESQEQQQNLGHRATSDPSVSSGRRAARLGLGGSPMAGLLLLHLTRTGDRPGWS